MIKDEDGFFGGRDNENILGADMLVHSGYGFAQAGGAEGFGVTAPLLEERVVSAWFEREKIGNGTRFRVGGREQIFRGELVFAHVLFNAKGRDLHKNSLARTLRDCRGPN